MSFGVHPAFLLAGFGLVVTLILLIFACRARSGLAVGLFLFFGFVFALPALFLFLELHPELFDDRYRTYKAFYQDIKVGMTRDEIFATIDVRYPRNGKRQRPNVILDEPRTLGFLMNRETSPQPHCEGIYLDLQNGRVINKTYSPD